MSDKYEGKTIVYAEKSDMAIKFASVLGGIQYNGRLITYKDLTQYADEIKKEVRKIGYIKTRYGGKVYFFTWGEGHVAGLKDIKDYNSEYKNWRKIPLPYIPKDFEIKGAEGKDKYNTIIKGLFTNPTTVTIISATDFGREGELIFDYAYRLSGTNKPYKRVRINETTEEGIRAGFKTEYSSDNNEPLVLAARARGIADWIVGINLTTQATLCYNNSTEKGSILNVGRVITPTLNLIVKRHEEIINYKEKIEYSIDGYFKTPEGSEYKGRIDDVRFKTEEDARDFMASLKNDGIITQCRKKLYKKRTKGPFNTPALQTEASKQLGLTVKEIDDIAQKLYDNGFISYPRTESRYLSEDLLEESIERIEMLRSLPEIGKGLQGAQLENGKLSPHKYFFNNKEIDDHYGIITTDKMPDNTLSELEYQVYIMIAREFAKIVMPEMLYAKIETKTTVNDSIFSSSGIILRERGWNLLDKKPYSPENDIPINIKEAVTVSSRYEIATIKSTKPTYYTDGTLITAMVNCGKTLADSEQRKVLRENKGIGTGATRGSIIARLLASKLIKREKKHLVPTEKGIHIIQSIDIPSLLTPEMTADWEIKLHEIEAYSNTDKIVDVDAARNKYNDFIEEVIKQTRKWCEEMVFKSKYTPNTSNKFISLKCPVCGKPLMEDLYYYFCDSECGFKTGKKINGREIGLKEYAYLFKHKKTPLLKGFTRKKDGKEYAAYLELTEENEVALTFYSIYNCPKCGNKLLPLQNYNGYYCEDHQCGFRMFTSIAKHQLTKTEIQKIFNGESTDLITDFKSKKGKTFSARLRLNNEYKIEYYFPESKTNQ